MIRRLAIAFALALVLAGAYAGLLTGGRRAILAQNQPDAHIMADNDMRLIRLAPECDRFRASLTEAGKGSPYAGSTAARFVQIMADAASAGCRTDR